MPFKQVAGFISQVGVTPKPAVQLDSQGGFVTISVVSALVKPFHKGFLFPA